MSQQKIIELNDPNMTANEMAQVLGYTPRYIRKVRNRLDLPRPRAGARHGRLNHGWNGGRIVDLDGYAVVRAPDGYHSARKIGVVLEHRLAAEKRLGRQLGANEVVDHIDGLTLHNAPENLRVFSSNGEHLQETLAGRPKSVSVSGRRKLKSQLPHSVLPRVDTYRLRKERGDVRLRAILLAALRLGIDSPHLLGTQQWLEKAGIDWSSRSSLQRALDDLSARWEEDLLR